MNFLFSVQIQSAGKTFVFDTEALKSVVRILRVIENAYRQKSGPCVPRLLFDDDGSLRLEE